MAAALGLAVATWPLVTPLASPRVASAYAGGVAAGLVLARIAYRPVAVTRRVPRWLAALTCAILAAFLLVPASLGWRYTTLSRQQVLDQVSQTVGNHRVEAKFVHADQRSAADIGDPSLQGFDLWVVASTSPSLAICGYVCHTPETWSVRILGDSSSFTGFEWVGPGWKESWPPFFDGLKDQLPPSWWPLVLPLPVALSLAVLTAVAGMRLLLPSGSPLGRRLRSHVLASSTS
jgi:hypothetical protein